MPPSRPKHPKRLDPRKPLVFDARDLGPGAARRVRRTCPAPDHLGAGMVRVPAGVDLELEVQFEGVAEGVLVTASVVAPLAAECARCLEPFTSVMRVRFQELYEYDAERAQLAETEEGEESYLLDGSGLLDLAPALRDAVVLELPLSPLCAEDCAGLCPECGIRLADAEANHRHARRGALWAALKDYQVTTDQAETGPGQ
jgi:DUF177 domain-containing protein